jgi:hypothetical protein
MAYRPKNTQNPDADRVPALPEARKLVGTTEPSPPEANRLRRRRCDERLLWRLARVAAALDISRRTLERERSAGRFPPPDLHIGKAPLWFPRTIRDWAAKGGGRPCP